MSVSPYLDGVMGLQEGGSAGAQILASMKTAGIDTAGYAPWILGATTATNTLGRYMAGIADRPAERQQYRLGDQQLQIGALNIKAEQQKQELERQQLRKQKALQSALSGIFGEYAKLKGSA